MSPASSLLDRLADGHVDIWQFELKLADIDLKNLRESLSEDEIQRADRFLRPTDSQRFVAARGNLRKILGQYLSISSGNVVFGYGEHGKPSIANSVNVPRIQFNLSHSLDKAVLAVSRDRPVGIDLEFASRMDRPDSLARSCLSDEELAEYEQLAGGSQEDDRMAGKVNFLLRTWTLKEAWTKAIGQGLRYPLRSMQVREQRYDIDVLPRFPPNQTNPCPAILPGDSRFEIQLDGDLQSGWQLQTWSIGAGADAVSEGIISCAIERIPVQNSAEHDDCAFTFHQL